MKGLLGHNTKLTGSKRYDRKVKKLIRRFPDLWPAVVVHGQERWQNMPADQFDWAIEQSVHRLQDEVRRRQAAIR